jgi:hypothetical protein
MLSTLQMPAKAAKVKRNRVFVRTFGARHRRS